ncbi:MAG TPA: divalent-cation tolerance protein CutA [bacterium]|uniref:Divalent-cation tolerance protein CutA n=1 Tax=candidate division TA06 bacterium ADurb.Bin417 TaxID=1852828 RepID=A0A1V5M5Z1_UNCT6|nr:MAG: Divalent-cation tolerance protein CutA [candidate division TA06 bacterium ADurb.Bin417]HNQ34568.1 divalent-cation tolerance protein CutA [bacterium]HNS48160.1 divalent-cation tolerance protein CutA [bacterium]
MKKDTGCLAVFVTCASLKEARKIARILVEEKAAACASLTAGVESLYWWEGKIERAGEVLLSAKTTRTRFPRLAALVRQNHSYQVPEIIALPIAAGSRPYLDWIEQSLR